MKTEREKADWKTISKFVEAHKDPTRKPPFVVVSDEQWAEALDGYYETFSEACDENESTQTAWSLIYFSAIAFCRGMEYAEVKAGTRAESYYPRY